MSSFRIPFWVISRQKTVHPLYRKCGRVAKAVKIVLQFIIGFGLAVLLLAKLFFTLIPPSWFKLTAVPDAAPRIQQLVTLPTLELVAIALEYSAGIELAYTLFTEGPDEAVEPVIMGLAAAMLLGFSKLGSIDILAGCAAVAFVIALAGLFLLRHYFVEPEEEHQPGAALPSGQAPQI